MPSITTIGLITCERTEPLQRAVESYLKNATSHQRTMECVVMDDSPNEPSRLANKTMLADLQRRFGIPMAYAGEPEKVAYAKALAQETQLPREVIEFSFLDPLKTGYSPGANRNALLLHTAGELLFCADDDTVCLLSAPVDQKKGLLLRSLTNTSEDLAAFSDAEVAAQAVHLVEADVLALHEVLLGKTFDELLDHFVEDGVDTSQASPEFAQRLMTDQGHVRLTWMGIMGDCGFRNPEYMLWLRGPGRQTAMRTDSSYQSACRSRQILRAPTRYVLGGEGGFFQSTAFGLDNRAMLPPFMPVHRGQDGLFGWTFLTCFKEDYSSYLPYAISHQPQPARESHTDDVWKTAGSAEFHRLLKLCFIHIAPKISANTPADRLRAMGIGLLELSQMDIASLEREVRHAWQRENERLEEALSQILKEYHGTPKAWSSDVKAAIKQIKSAAWRQERMQPLQSLLKNFGQMLSVWPELVEAAKRLRSKGIRLAQPLE